MFVYYLAWVLVLILGFIGVKFWKEDQGSSILALILFVVGFVTMTALIPPAMHEGKPISFLTNTVTYTLYSQTNLKGEYAYLTLGDKDGKNPKLYKILKWKLRHENREIFNYVPDKFKVKTGTIASIEEKNGFHQKGKTLKVYFVILAE